MPLSTNLWRLWHQCEQHWDTARRRSPRLDRGVSVLWHSLNRQGPELAAAMTVRGILALVPMVAAALAVLGVAVNDPRDQQRLTAVLLDAFLPGLAGPVLPDQPLPIGSSAAVVLALAAVVALSLGWVRSLRRGLRSMFDLRPGPSNLLREKLDDLITLAWLGALLSAITATAFFGRLLILLITQPWASAQTTQYAMDAGTQLLGVAGVWCGTLLLCRRVLPAEHASRRDRLTLATLTAAATTLLKAVFIAYTHVAGARNGTLYGAFAAVAGLIVWLSLVHHSLLLAAAWTQHRPQTTGASRGTT